MTSSSKVVRSLSADESATALPRRNPAIPAPRHAEHKSKTGLFKRIRRVFRIPAQSTRLDKHPTHPPHHPLYPNDIPPQHPHLAPDKHPPHTRKHSPAPRARTWRDGISSRALNLSSSHSHPHPHPPPQRQGPELGASKSDSRRFMSLRASATDASKKVSATFSNAESASVSSHHSAQPRAGSHRSLPKRVFSSPPSFSGRGFGGFASRKRMSTSGKPGGIRGSSHAGDVGEGDQGREGKLAKSINARHAPHVGPGSAVAPTHSAANFAVIIEGATAGRVAFRTLLDEMYRLEERLPPTVKDLLMKYLTRQQNMEALIDNLTVVLPPSPEDDGMQMSVAARERYRYSYVATMLLSNGPIQLRRSLFLDPKHLDRLVRVLGHGAPNDPILVRSVCKVLLNLLKDSPEDTVGAMARRKDFIEALLSHIAVTGCPEVCLSMLSTVRCQAELKFGPSNKKVVGMMADSRLVMTLCDKLADAAESGPLDGTSSSTIENCSRVIVGIALRALVIPRFEINDDDSDASYMRKFNNDLSSLDVFSQPTPILRLLDSGLTALAAHDSRGYALSTALTAARYLLVTALKGQDSSLSTIRLQLLAVNTSMYEAGIRARIPRLAKVLEHARAGAVVQTMWEKVENPLGVVRLKILELIVVLLQHCSEATARAIAKAEIPRILLDLFVRLRLNSLLQHFVAAIVELSFASKFSCLRRAFLVDVQIVDKCMDLWNGGGDGRRQPIGGPANYRGELLRIICAVHDILKHDTEEVQEMKRDIGLDKIEAFKQFCEGPVADKLKQNGPLLGGPGELPPRPMDSFSFDGYSSMGGSQGSLLVRSRGSGRSETT